MSKSPKKSAQSAFHDLGFAATVEALVQEVQHLYQADAIPWVVGYSGGKDSTATLELVWLALQDLPATERTKPVHVISTDTLVENPIVAAWVTNSLDTINESAQAQHLPIQPHRLTPKVNDSFWVNLIGRGYPAPRHKFRWCTERLKIKPSNEFITNVVRENGEAILVLGTRKAESSRRASVMTKLEGKRLRDRLSPNESLPNSLVYSPIENWSDDDVWLFLMQRPNPWGYNNKDLLTMYQGATEGGECPLVVDTSTPSCGDSRFGCWVCTLVDQDRSMQAMIQNNEEKEWMLPLLQLRNELDVKDDRPLRDFRRMSGKVQLFHNDPIHGPYTQQSRENWLRRLLKAQAWVREHGPDAVRNIELVSEDELHEIRRIWVIDKHEIEDSLPSLYQEETGQSFPGEALDEHLPFGAHEMGVLKGICGDDRMKFELVRELLDIERRFRTKTRRVGLHDALEDAIRRHFFVDKDDATEHARLRLRVLEEVEPKDVDPELSAVHMEETESQALDLGR